MAIERQPSSFFFLLVGDIAVGGAATTPRERSGIEDRYRQKGGSKHEEVVCGACMHNGIWHLKAERRAVIGDRRHDRRRRRVGVGDRRPDDGDSLLRSGPQELRRQLPPIFIRY